MRINYYVFPEETALEDLAAYGVSLLVVNEDSPHYGDKFNFGVLDTELERLDKYAQLVAEGHVFSVEPEDRYIGAIRVTEVKRLLKKYGGEGFTRHFERDGGLFEVSMITLKGNNSRFKYNHHL